ncbi:ABC transporter C family member 3, partial [Dichanthelium oligosanthes]
LLGFLASKTVVYVTHHVEFLPSADLILVMRDGKITQSGDYTEILKSGEELMELVGSHKDALSTLDILECPRGNFDSTSHPGGNASTLFIAEDKKHDNSEEEKIVQNGQLVQEEEREKGRVRFIIYRKYITMAYYGTLVPFILLAQIIFQVLQIAIVSSLCIFMRSHLLVMAGCKTATILFEKMHEYIFRAPMSFFDSTPSGRILNRASSDQSTVDTRIFGLMGYLIFPPIEILGTVVLMSQLIAFFTKFLYAMQVRYAPRLPFVLKGLTCTLPGGKKTGIVGRTGGGKSTLIQALFRILDPSIGQVFIDGIDICTIGLHDLRMRLSKMCIRDSICTIGLHDLRMRLSIIPQDPVVFEGTLRSNIDPLGEYSDEQIWEALDSCHLGDEVRKNELKLDSTGSISNRRSQDYDVKTITRFLILKCSDRKWQKLERRSAPTCVFGKGNSKKEKDLGSG